MSEVKLQAIMKFFVAGIKLGGKTAETLLSCHVIYVL
jgi:hypothetical protein